MKPDCHAAIRTRQSGVVSGVGVPKAWTMPTVAAFVEIDRNLYIPGGPACEAL